MWTRFIKDWLGEFLIALVLIAAVSFLAGVDHAMDAHNHSVEYNVKIAP